MNWKRWITCLLVGAFLAALYSFFTNTPLFAHEQRKGCYFDGKQWQNPRYLRPGKPILAVAGKIRQFSPCLGWQVVDRDYRQNLKSSRSGRETCATYVPEAAAAYRVSADLLVRIIQCESGGRPWAKNPNSTASGCGQFLRSTWRRTPYAAMSPFDARAGTMATAWGLATWGTGPWAASRKCWSR